MINSNKPLKKDEKVDEIPFDGDYISGSRVYMRNCASCHSLEANSAGRKTSGPALGTIYGKHVGQD